MNERHAAKHPQHADLAARTESYELAFRMQTAIPGVVAIDQEPERVRREYGLDRKETAAFGKQCLMARRLVETGRLEELRHKLVE